MQQDKTKIWLILFGLLSIINLGAEFTHWRVLIFLTKPLLMILLSVYFYLNTKERPSAFSKLILGGFIFSIAGDTFLMFVEDNPEKQLYFLLGLSSFLVTHICYLFAFLKYKTPIRGLIQRKPWLLLFFGLFLLGNLSFMWPDIPEDLKSPVAVYSIVIVMMAASSLNLSGKLPSSIFNILLLGALCFVLSDSIIGLNKFKSTELPLPYPRLLIMIPYLTSQYLLAKGSIMANDLLNKKFE